MHVAQEQPRTSRLATRLGVCKNTVARKRKAPEPHQSSPDTCRMRLACTTCMVTSENGALTGIRINIIPNLHNATRRGRKQARIESCAEEFFSQRVSVVVRRFDMILHLRLEIITADSVLPSHRPVSLRHGADSKSTEQRVAATSESRGVP